MYKDSRGEFRWYLKAANGSDKLADSGEGYKNKQDCIAGMTRVMETTRQTPWYDLTD